MKKKAKRYQSGGLAGIADTANSLMGEVDGMANTIKYGSEAGSGRQALGFSAINQPRRNAFVDPTTVLPAGGKAEGLKLFSSMLSGQKTFKKGGKVKSIDGIAQRGKTRAKHK